MSSPVNNEPPKQHRPRGLFSLLITLLWLGLLVLIFVNRYNIIDWWKLHDYQAPATISALVEQDTMTPYGRKIFYINHPQIDDKQVFATNCPNNGGEQTIVLGCYKGGQTGIYLLKVNDPRLNGVVQVTAAHEMLHGAYERLNAADRKKVDAMLLDYYKNDLKDPRVLKTIAAYKKSEPNDVVNEMHSVFGTEIANLPSGLEEYYKRYFTDRARVAAYAAQYQSEFTSREAIVAGYDAQLANLKQQITTGESDLQAKQSQIDEMQNKLLAQKNSGDVGSYNAGVPAFNNLVNQYNAEVQTVRDLISQYNQLVSERNAIALEEDQLVKDLSTDSAPAPISR